MSELEILQQQRDAYRNLAIIFHQKADGSYFSNVERSTKIVDDTVAKLCKVAHDENSPDKRQDHPCNNDHGPDDIWPYYLEGEGR
jgi:hypothetical protein